MGKLALFLLFVTLVVIVINSSQPERTRPSSATPAVASSTPAEPRPIDAFRIEKSRWKREGFGTVAEATFWLRNGNAYPVRDAEIMCFFYGESGTPIHIRRATVFERFPANEVKRTATISFGFVDRQVRNVRCDTVSVRR